MRADARADAIAAMASCETEADGASSPATRLAARPQRERRRLRAVEPQQAHRRRPRRQATGAKQQHTWPHEPGCSGRERRALGGGGGGGGGSGGGVRIRISVHHRAGVCRAGARARRCASALRIVHRRPFSAPRS